MLALLTRLIEIIVLLSVIRSFVNYLRRLWHGIPRYVPPIQRPQAPRPNPADSATVLRQDPVCGTYVAVDTSLKKIVAGTVYHFCSAECRAKFVQ